MDEPVPLTPAEQMRRIRQSVSAAEAQSTEQAYAILGDYFSRLDGLRDRIVTLESKMVLKEQPFTSNAPVIGRLIVAVRTAWNWMSTKWYLIPLLQQQTDYNMALAQTLRETMIVLESTLRSVQDMQRRIKQLEEAQQAGEGCSQESDAPCA